MAAPKAQCSACNAEIQPGVLFCFQHASEPPKVASFRSDHGQLLWATEKSRGSAEHALAVLIDGKQVAVRDVSEQIGQRPAKLVLYYAAPAASETSVSDHAEIELSAVLEALLAGSERIDAKRPSNG